MRRKFISFCSTVLSGFDKDSVQLDEQSLFRRWLFLRPISYGAGLKRSHKCPLSRRRSSDSIRVHMYDRNVHTKLYRPSSKRCKSLIWYALHNAPRSIVSLEFVEDTHKIFVRDKRRTTFGLLFPSKPANAVWNKLNLFSVVSIQSPSSHATGSE